MITLKALAALLTYPEAELLAALSEVGAAIDGEGLLPRRERAAIASFLAELGESDLFDLQERYVAFFDRSRSLSLHLFEHVHGESRDRGQAMVNLLQVYRDQGLELAASELPDYLPVFLEYLSQRPFAEAKTNLAETSHILRELGTRLLDKGSGYAAVFSALLVLAGEKGLDFAGRRGRGGEEPEDLDALDREWAEEPAFGCGPKPPKGREQAVIHVYRGAAQ
jgi:nitrate reductase delta subunit